MKTRMVVLLVVALGLRVACAEDHARQKLAEELLVLMKMQDSMQKSLDMLKKTLPAQIQQMSRTAGGPQAPVQASAQADRVMALVAAEMSWDKLKGDYVKLYSETFTEEELRGLVDFYKSPAGQTFTAKQPEVMRRSMEISQRAMMQILPKIQDPNWLRNADAATPPDVEK